MGLRATRSGGSPLSPVPESARGVDGSFHLEPARSGRRAGSSARTADCRARRWRHGAPDSRRALSLRESRRVFGSEEVWLGRRNSNTTKKGAPFQRPARSPESPTVTRRPTTTRPRGPSRPRSVAAVASRHVRPHRSGLDSGVERSLEPFTSSRWPCGPLHPSHCYGQVTVTRSATGTPRVSWNP